MWCCWTVTFFVPFLPRESGGSAPFQSADSGCLIFFRETDRLAVAIPAGEFFRSFGPTGAVFALP